MSIKRFLVIALLGLAFAWSCKKLYAPFVVSTPSSYLVVEGLIAAGGDSTIINLSRTVQLSKLNTTKPEIGAKVTVDDQNGISYPLLQADSGRYVASPLSLDNSHKYRLNIVTTDGQTYVSDYEPVKITPPIDTVTYRFTTDALNIFANTHDPSNSTHYYRWAYTETYIYKSLIEADYIYDPTQLIDTLASVLRTPAQQVHTCYVTINSSSILLNSSASLSQDVIANAPITQIGCTSEKLFNRYSILIKQYALTQDAYNFFTLEKRNTEQIGTIFDQQPSNVKGNIHCTSNQLLTAIGFISVSSVSRKRIFIDHAQVPNWYLLSSCELEPPTCSSDTSYCWSKDFPHPPNEITAGIYLLRGPIKKGKCFKQTIDGYNVAIANYNCADCRIHLGGKTGKPAFWK